MQYEHNLTKHQNGPTIHYNTHYKKRQYSRFQMYSRLKKINIPQKMTILQIRVFVYLLALAFSWGPQIVIFSVKVKYDTVRVNVVGWQIIDCFTGRHSQRNHRDPLTLEKRSTMGVGL